MREIGSSYSIVLAAGQGARLANLAVDARGRSVPKQYCSLRGGRSLLGDALSRAGSVAAPQRVLTIVAEEHREHWEPELAAVPRERIIVQPENRGTAAGILLPLLAIAEQDPRARVAIVPSDHYVRREIVLAGALLRALAHTAREQDTITLLGIRPDIAETSYGWIVPARGEQSVRRVERFVEKPPPALAAELHAQGGLWNGFLLAARVDALLAVFEHVTPELLSALRAVYALRSSERSRALRETYAALPALDFSRDVQERVVELLRVIEVPACGWTDLGTPERVATCVRAAPPAATAMPARAYDAPVVLAQALGAQRREHVATA